MARIFQSTDEALEARDGGLLHMHINSTQIEEHRKHGGKLKASTFLIASITKALHPKNPASVKIELCKNSRYSTIFSRQPTKPSPMKCSSPSSWRPCWEDKCEIHGPVRHRCGFSGVPVAGRREPEEPAQAGNGANAPPHRGKVHLPALH